MEGASRSCTSTGAEVPACETAEIAALKVTHLTSVPEKAVLGRGWKGGHMDIAEYYVPSATRLLRSQETCLGRIALLQVPQESGYGLPV